MDKKIIVFLCVIVSTLLLDQSLLFAARPCKKPLDIPHFNEDSYYKNARGLAGNNLKSALNKIIRGHRQYNYKCVWTILKETDEDPNNSENVILLYTGRSQPKPRRDFGGRDSDAWNREHVWAKSHGFPKKNQHAYTDVHHLRPADKSVNSARGNKDFDDIGENHKECKKCVSSKKSWGAPPTVRGDVARMLFYMVVRYEGSDKSKTPDLELENKFTESKKPRLGKLCSLYKWHFNDPVSPFEKKRHEVIYSWQGNRNPFIDHPGFAKAIWGDDCPSVTIPDEVEEPTEFTDKEKIEAIVRVLEKKGVLTQEEITQEIKKMRD